MSRWRVSIDDDTGQIMLPNQIRTVIKINKRYEVDLIAVISSLNKLNFPFRFCEGVEEINFTHFVGLDRENLGRYMCNKIGVNVPRHRKLAKPEEYHDQLVGTVIHEIIHHVDDSENEISSKLQRERKRAGLKIHDECTDEGEYLARGAENFYSPDEKEREDLRINHPDLYALLLKLHKKYS